MPWNWQYSNWPNFSYQESELNELLYDYGKSAGKIIGRASSQHSHALKSDLIINTIVSEAINTSSIEGENINAEEVRSSIKRQLGFSEKTSHNLKAEGIASLMIKCRQSFAEKLNKKTLLEWHNLLMQGQILIPLPK